MAEESGFKEWPKLPAVIDAGLKYDLLTEEEKQQYPLFMRAYNDVANVQRVFLDLFSQFLNIQKIIHAFPKGRAIDSYYIQFFTKFDDVLRCTAELFESMAPYAFSNEPKVFYTVFKKKLEKFKKLSTQWMPLVSQYVAIIPVSIAATISIPKMNEFSKKFEEYERQIIDIFAPINISFSNKLNCIAKKREEAIKQNNNGDMHVQLNTILNSLNKITARRLELEKATENLAIIMRALNATDIELEVVEHTRNSN
ncbi:hypothetical protein TVAG_189670 [Trichomonas vaginalis G3]|uniref:Uncharacterized protein n=1 Tax=Trichomonas vaginalis (strain ATCC PRA-98 / G3) TaxID=412133 RepID=A2DK99_TRIV3|nr:hypothetical protein TVAGG3_0995810 [Trichomonas vaginalis G3]EAY19076.1 hypothetical protein TVAG_189670 [Trichomonas vaginalis G3]KAI5490376.1 hypothetical protein TVAGG3_0995810 [Trichomonas vaginalis G3]|eukprot:XP_001580062.1 hypothetical protein [Trichomonas vaginalis G3]